MGNGALAHASWPADQQHIHAPRLASAHRDPLDVALVVCDHQDSHMAIRMTATQAKARILSVLDDVEAGEEVEITRHGRIVARLVPASGPHALKGVAVSIAIDNASDEELFSTGAEWSLR
jgi:prevent-host-death family protein